MSEKNNDELSFEDALGELETLVKDMEAGDLSLEDSLKTFERGVHLTKTCQIALKDAEQKVSILTHPALNSPRVPFDKDE